MFHKKYFIVQILIKMYNYNTHVKYVSCECNNLKYNIMLCTIWIPVWWCKNLMHLYRLNFNDSIETNNNILIYCNQKQICD